MGRLAAHVPKIACMAAGRTAWKIAAKVCRRADDNGIPVGQVMCDALKNATVEDKAVTNICDAMHVQFKDLPVADCVEAVRKGWEGAAERCDDLDAQPVPPSVLV